MVWKLTEAESKLGELMTRAVAEGPQTIRRSEDAVVVVSEEKYLELTGGKLTFKQWLLGGPRTDNLEIPARGQSPMREVEL
jgi:prevent-host-death family protein